MGTINELHKKRKYIKLHFVLRCIEVKGLETKYRSYNVLPSEMVSFYIFLTQGFDFDLISNDPDRIFPSRRSIIFMLCGLEEE